MADKLKNGLSPILGNDITNELVDKGVSSVKGFAKNKLDAVQSTLQGRGHHYKMYGGKLSFDFGKMASVLKNVGKVAIPIAAELAGGPAAGVLASAASDVLL